MYCIYLYLLTDKCAKLEIIVFFLWQLIDYAKKGDTDEKAMKMADFWLTVWI